MKYYWILDNGHGTPCRLGGKHSPKFDDGYIVKEAEFNRAVVDRICEIVFERHQNDLWVKVLVPEDEDVGLRDRVRWANAHAKNQAEAEGLKPILVSVHANAHKNDNIFNDANGVETWHYSATGGRIARIFRGHIIDKTGLRDRGTKQAYAPPFNTKIYLLKHTSMPAILTENGFMTNFEEASLMRTEDFINQVAEAHVSAMLEIERNGI